MNTKQVTRFLALIGFTLLFLLDLVGGFKWFSNFKDFVALPFIVLYANTSHSISQYSQSILSTDSLKSQNFELRTRIIELETKLNDAALQQSIKEQSSKKIITYGVDPNTTKISALVIDSQIGNRQGVYRINKGTMDGVAVKDIALVAGVYTGFVVETSDHTAVIQTIFSQDFTEKGTIVSKKILGLVKLRNNALILTEVLPNENVEKTDIVTYLTTNGSTAIPIGKVESVALTNNQSSKEALLTPFIEEQDIFVVAIIKP